MSTQPQALRLAEHIHALFVSEWGMNSPMAEDSKIVLAELRRLHAENDALRTALAKPGQDEHDLTTVYLAGRMDERKVQRTEPEQPVDFVCSTGLCFYKRPVTLTDEEIENIALNLADAEIGRALKGEETNFSVEFARAVIAAYQRKQEGKA